MVSTSFPPDSEVERLIQGEEQNPLPEFLVIGSPPCSLAICVLEGISQEPNRSQPTGTHGEVAIGRD